MISLPHVFLASRSPRRRDLLEACGIPFDIVDIEIDESKYATDLPIRDIAEYLAVEKAAAARIKVREGIILAADSLVICNESVLGKPEDREDAVNMLRLLSNRTHEVVTGVCISDLIRHVAYSETSLVTFAELTEDDINFYIDQYQPFDKAGSYAVQEWIGYCKIARIEGSYTNIMGLPTESVYWHLESW